MAICFVKAKVIGRSGGQSAVAAAAYRSGLKLTDDRTGDIHDYRKKRGVDYSEILTPFAAINENDWLTDRSKLWNKVEASEIRSDAQLSREMIIAIPIELDRDAMIKLVCEHVQGSYVDRGMIADINLHDLDGNNPHAHIMLTMRELIINGEGTINFGKKNRAWNDKKLVETQKREWGKLANQCLKHAGIDARIDSRSYEEQGINKIPQIHVGAAASRMEKRGIKTQRGDHNREVAIANQKIANTQADINQAQKDLAALAAEFAQESERRAAAKVSESLPINQPVTRRKSFDSDDMSLFAKAVVPPPTIAKWSGKREVNPQLLRSILQVADRLGAVAYRAGHYEVQILPDEIKIVYQNNSVMILYPSACNALPLDRSYTVDQYGLGLQRSLDILITDLDQPPQNALEQLDQSDQPAPIVQSPNVAENVAKINQQQLEVEKLNPKSQSLQKSNRNIEL